MRHVTIAGHPCEAVRMHCDATDPGTRWRDCAPSTATWVARIRELEALAERGTGLGPDEREELWRLYDLTFAAFRLKGMAAADRQTTGQRGGTR